MNWNDLEVVWKRQPEAPVEADLTRLKATFETRHRRQAAALFVRDVSEASAGFVVVAVLGVVTLMAHLSFASRTALIVSMGLTAAVTAFFVSERLRARRRRLGAEAPLIAKVEADLSELRRQHALLAKVIWWYFLPLFIGWALVCYALAQRAVSSGTARDLMANRAARSWILAYLVLVPLLFLWAWRVNLRVAKRRLLPRIEELEKLRAGLSSDS